MVILLSKSSLKDNYSVWLKNLYPEIQLSDAYSADPESFDDRVQQCSGIVLTGGADINPALYGKVKEKPRCEGIDDKRDQLEITLVKAALDKKIPLLAICRGLQLMNICFNGSLIVDIPSDYGKLIKHRNKKDVRHEIKVAKDTNLYRLGQALNFMVNSSHHQAVKNQGDGLEPVAWAEDMIIEAMELNHRFSHPFFIGIQWHPERMEVYNPMSGSLGRAFLQKAEQYSSTSRQVGM